MATAGGKGGRRLWLLLLSLSLSKRARKKKNSNRDQRSSPPPRALARPGLPPLHLQSREKVARRAPWARWGRPYLRRVGKRWRKGGEEEKEKEKRKCGRDGGADVEKRREEEEEEQEEEQEKSTLSLHSHSLARKQLLSLFDLESLACLVSRFSAAAAAAAAALLSSSPPPRVRTRSGRSRKKTKKETQNGTLPLDRLGRHRPSPRRSLLRKDCLPAARPRRDLRHRGGPGPGQATGIRQEPAQVKKRIGGREKLDLDNKRTSTSPLSLSLSPASLSLLPQLSPSFRWWSDYADRKNDDEADEHVADSLLYDRRHLPRTAPAPGEEFFFISLSFSFSFSFSFLFLLPLLSFSL